MAREGPSQDCTPFHCSLARQLEISLAHLFASSARTHAPPRRVSYAGAVNWLARGRSRASPTTLK